MILRACVLWLLALSALGASACAPQRDLVALRRMAASSSGTPSSPPNSPCGDAGCSPCADGGCSDPCLDGGCSDPCADGGCLRCGAADSCMTDPRCADAAICQPPPPMGECRSRTCSQLSNQAEFCGSNGSAIALGDVCASSTDNPRFQYALCSRDSLQTQQHLTVRGDVAVDGDISIEDTAQVDGTVYFAKSLRESRPALLTADRTEHGAARCTPEDGLSLDIAGAVKAHMSDNDNAAASGMIEKLRHFTGDLSVTLPCGRYYVTGLEGDGQVVIRAQGNLALFIDGNVQLERHLRVEAEGEARVSILVNGAFNVAHEGVELGTTADARHLLAVTRQVHLESDGQSVIGGVLYAPTSELLVTHKLSISGAVFVGSGRLFGETTLDFAPAATFAANSCGPKR